MSKVKMQQTQSRRERKKQETRQRLIECAWRLLQERGYDDTTIEAITEAADVSKGTFFNYFETKEVLLDELALWRIDSLGSHVLAADDVPQGAVARIKRMVRAMAAEFSPERELPQHLFIARISAPIRRESAHRLGSIMHDLVQQGQASGEIRADVDAGLIARLLITCVFHHFMWFHHPKDGHLSPGATPGAGPHPVPADGCHPPDGPPDVVRPRPAVELEAQNALSLEAKLIESVDALMDGLGGPSWRNS
jgi:AcrR family transcriptional regulator